MDDIEKILDVANIIYQDNLNQKARQLDRYHQSMNKLTQLNSMEHLNMEQLKSNYNRIALESKTPGKEIEINSARQMAKNQKIQELEL